MKAHRLNQAVNGPLSRAHVPKDSTLHFRACFSLQQRSSFWAPASMMKRWRHQAGLSHLSFMSLMSLVVWGLASCSMVPPLKQSEFSVPSQFKEHQPGSTSSDQPSNASASSSNTLRAMDPLGGANPSKAVVDSRGLKDPRDEFTNTPWWRELADPLLNDFEDKLILGNVSLRQIAAQVRVAQASLKQAEASLFPTLNLNLSASRAANQLSVPKGTSYSLSAPMSWELDVWGRIDALTQVAAANVRASQYDLLQAKVSTQALLVQSHVTWLSAKAQESLLGETVKVLEKSLALTQARYRGGVVSSADVAQASTQLKSTQAQWLDVVSQRKQVEHALTTLLGLVPAQWSAIAPLASPASAWRESTKVDDLLTLLPPVPKMPEVLVLDVLQYRPDIQAAKRRVEAANAQLGVARAAFFPPLVLSASAGYRNTDFATLISAPNQAWSIGPSLVLPLIDGGLRQGAKDGAQAQLDNAVLAYQQLVLNAFQEIEDNLVAREQLRLMSQSLLEAAQSAERNLDVVNAQYKSGVVPYLSVVSAQTALLSVQRSLLDVRSRQILAWNQLQKNISIKPSEKVQ